MKWFDRWFAKKCQQAWNDASINSSRNEHAVEDDDYSRIKFKPRRLGVISGASVHIGQSPSRTQPRSEIDARPMMFKLYTASGGWVLEYNFYDEANDTTVNTLHVIGEDEDLGQAISRAITFEVLRK